MLLPRPPPCCVESTRQTVRVHTSTATLRLVGWGGNGAMRVVQMCSARVRPAFRWCVGEVSSLFVFFFLCSFLVLVLCRQRSKPVLPCEVGEATVCTTHITTTPSPVTKSISFLLQLPLLLLRQCVCELHAPHRPNPSSRHHVMRHHPSNEPSQRPKRAHNATGRTSAGAVSVVFLLHRSRILLHFHRRVAGCTHG